MTAFRRMGDFAALRSNASCLCGHDVLDHEDGPCDATSEPDETFLAGEPCGCEWFEDDDPDADYDPGLDEPEVAS